MKTIITLCLLMCAFTIEAQETKVNWLTDLEEAKQISKKQDKPIIVYFTGSDWCKPCKMLKEDFFSSDKFSQKSKEYVLVKVDIPRRKDLITPVQYNKNMMVVQQYNKRGSFPTLVGMDSKGKVLEEISGYNMMRDTGYHFAFLDKVTSKY